MDNNNMVLGIDLGTTNSCIAIYRNQKAEVIKNNIGLKCNTINNIICK